MTKEIEERVAALVHEADGPERIGRRAVVLSEIVACACKMHQAALRHRDTSGDGPEADRLVRRTRLVLSEFERLNRHAHERADDALESFQTKVLDMVEAAGG